MRPRTYYVIRDYSHTDKRCLWSVLSRPQFSCLNARDTLDWLKGMFKPKGPQQKRWKTFVVEVIPDEEIRRRLDAGEHWQEMEVYVAERDKEENQK